ncbi:MULTISPECIES: TauD/TfdA dioxygenase family protein [Streptomyces]|uniref:TauD/TfdA dioxygenase family protein n=1 Tax=Streptomyces TaxID=1883 RepID=UPI00017F1AB2|nr:MULTISPECIES: TauD/TfdA family dioxygenase [Streptomyces]AKL71108.1 taurine dioxygenase [Streptomyces sp. Mg1]OKI38136.1 taurine dioxygenase [Streptomyces sp. CB03578]WBY24931.1 TauD/TfdA family dioxygenase [Streptomyces goshikiensis]WSS04005.1 TauD/TfdA family dioxygenase [Streptomyces goshikiensis]
MSTFDIRKIGGRIGAEVTGVDLSAGLSDSVFGQINEAFLEHKVLFFRNQDITDEQQLAFAGRFGPLTRKHPMMRAVDTAAPHVLAVDGEDQRADHWHTDISFTTAPSLGTTLRSVVLPPYGGDTLVANAAAGYRDLPAELRKIADRLWAVHTNHAEQPRLGTERGDKVREAFLSRRFETAHPVVRVHPESGEPSLFLGGFAQWLVGMEVRESRPIIDVLQSYVRRPENTARWTWRPGDVLVFDNRSTQHYAVNDYGTHKRVLHRVSVNGEVPVGLDGRPSYALKEGE